MSKSYLIKLVKSARDKQNNRTIWEMFFVLEQLLSGGKNRKTVTAAIAKRVRKVICLYRPSPYRPKGIIYSVEQWFNDPVPPQMEGSWIKDIFPEHTVILKEPNHITGEIHPNFIKCGKSHLSKKTQLCFLKNARVVNEHGVVISFDDKVFSDFVLAKDSKLKTIMKVIEEQKVFKSYINKPQVRKECLATITSPEYIGYYHWLIEGLPRLKILEEVMDEIDYLIVPSNLKRFHIESLNLLGFPEDKLVKIKNGSHLLCENLFVSSTLRPRPFKWACDFLRERYIPSDVTEPHRLIYISRKDAIYRKITNEEEVEKYLQNIGFEIVQMSELTFLEGVKICAEAKIVVGPHGAGLCNIVFCQDAKILEIFSPSYVDTSYWFIANMYENEYYYLLGEDAPGNSPPPWRDFEVDMGTLKSVMDEMLGDV